MVSSMEHTKVTPNEVTSADGGGPLRFAFAALRPATAEFCRWTL